jgi:hypothetical protein
VKVSAALNGTGAVITVDDSGSGIDATLADKVFEPFFTTKSKGTGLGLAIVRRLVEAHGGTISIENRVGPGARVTVRLPTEHSSDVSAPEPTSALAKSSAQGGADAGTLEEEKDGRDRRQGRASEEWGAGQGDVASGVAPGTPPGGGQGP